MFPFQKGLVLFRHISAVTALSARAKPVKPSVIGEDPYVKTNSVLPSFAQGYFGNNARVVDCQTTTGIKPPLYLVNLALPTRRHISADSHKKHTTKIIADDNNVDADDNVQIIYNCVEGKATFNGSVQVLTTSSEELHEAMRSQGHCEIIETHDLEEVLNPGDKVISKITAIGRGPYFGGVPTSGLPKPLGEQIFADPVLLVTEGGMDAWKKIGDCVDSGPRLSSEDAIALVQRQDGTYYQAVVGQKAFVNSSIHYGSQTDKMGNAHPQVNFTPGAGLYHFIKFKLKILPNGEVLQTFSTCTSASANVLTHWLCNLVETMSTNGTGISRELDPQGLFHQRVVGKGTGELFKAMGTILTGSPFLMSTVTIRYDKSGNVLNMVLLSQSKLWPSSETCLEIKPAEGPDPQKEKKIMIYNMTIPQAGVMGDFTVSKLLTIKLNKSVVAYSIGENGKLTSMEESSDVYQLMMKQNEATQFTPKELYENGASLGIRLSYSKSDARAHVSLVSTGEDITQEEMEQKLESLILQDPESMEHYFCGLCVKHAVKALRKMYDENPVGWEKDNPYRHLYDFLIGKTPTYANLMEAIELHRDAIDKVMKGSPENAVLMDKYRILAMRANTEAIIQQGERFDDKGPILS